MENKSLDINNIVASASNLVDAIGGLDSFVHHNLSDINDVKMRDLNILTGLIAAIQVLADKNAKEIDEFSTFGGAAIEK